MAKEVFSSAAVNSTDGALTSLLRGIAAVMLLLSVCAYPAGGWFAVIALILAGYSLLYAAFSLVGSRGWQEIGLAFAALSNLLRMVL